MRLSVKRVIICLFLISIFCAGGDIYSSSVSTNKDSLPLEVTAEVDKVSVNIGDKLRYTITAAAGRDIEIEMPKFGENLGDFTIRDFGTSEGGWWFFGKKRLVQWYILDIYETGKYTIPKSIIRYRKKGEKEWKSIETDEIEIEVISLLDNNGKKGDIRGIREPVGLPFRVNPYLIEGILLVILAAAGGIWFFFFRKKREPEIKRPSVPAHEAAYRRLERLREKELIKEGRVKDYYIELSDCVRHYLEDRFTLRAPEMATEEFLGMLKDSRELSYDHKVLLKEFLVHCDMVKFAKYGPGKSEIDASLESAFRLVDETKTMEAVG
ncbi:MAG: hypothetical protein ACE5EA_00290 [Nitrospirota bacterium]